MITMQDILGRVPAILGDRPDKRWARASLTLRGSDGVSRETYFNSTSYADRLKLVSEKLTSGKGWAPLLQRSIPKPSAMGTRPICWASCTDTAVIYALTDAIEPHVEAKLSNIAVAYRKGRPMTGSIISAVSMARSRGLTTVCVTDIQDFYGSIPWEVLDTVIDALPLDEHVKALLQELVRVEVRRVEDGARVERYMGVPQGLALSPVLANLFMVAFDRQMAVACGQIGCLVRRYADDILLLCPSVQAGERARELVRRQLGSLTLAVKEGTGKVVDLSAEGNSATWLGVKLWGVRTETGTVVAMDIPTETIESKAHELRTELEAGLTTAKDIGERLGHLGMYWASLVPRHRARKAIESIQNHLANGLTPVRGMTNQISEMTSGISDKKEVPKNQGRTIDQMIHPYSRTPRTTRDEDGKRETGRVAFHAGRTVGIKKKEEERRLSGESPQAPQRPMDRHGEDTRDGAKDDGTFPSSTPRVSKDRIGVPTPHGVDAPVPIPLHGGADPLRGASAVERMTELELHRSDDLRVVSTGRDGMPAVLHPIRSRKRIVVRAEAHGSKDVLVQVNVDDVWGFPRKLKVDHGTSTAEAVLMGFEVALSKLDIDEMTDVTLVTSEPTISGYIAKGWRVRSFALLGRLRALEKYAVDSGNIQAPASGTGP